MFIPTMPTSISIFFFFILLLLSSAPYQLTSTRIHIHHRILHQPFFPQDSSPPTQPPSSSPSSDQTTKPPQQPKYPFSSTTPPNKPFFPSFPSPPPPPPSSTSSSPSTTFPANISALIFPQPPHKKPISPKLVAIVVILSLFSAAFIISVVLLIYCKKRRNFPTNKTTSRSDSHRLFPANNPIYSDTNNIHKVRRNGPSGVSGTSSEFLYLGTLVNSHGIDGGDGGANVGSAASSSPYQKLGSPELRPLPPLARQNYSREFETVEVGRDRERGTGTGTGTSREDEDEEFYSPRGSSGDKESLGRTGSSSRRVFAGPAMEHFESRSSSSSSPSYPTSNSASPSNNSISNSSRSSISKSKSPVFITTLPPPPPPPPPPPRPMTPSPPKRKPPSSSPPSSPPERDLLKNPHSNQWPSARINGVSSYSRSGPPPPHPPPPPPPKFWETPIPSVQIHQQQQEEVSRPPVLITPSRPVLFQNSELLQNSESVEKGEETPKLKLKPLHWDKVRASSDRAMVWDQLKSSSFQ